MRLFRCALCMMMFPVPVLALPAPYAPTLSGARFVSMLTRPEPLNSADYIEREKAYSYLDGSRDSAEGRVWCDADHLKTPDMAYELADDIAKLPAAQQAKNASLLILDLLRQKYPCRKARMQ